MANIIMCDPKGGSSTELTGSWGQIHVEKVTAGTNSITNMQEAIKYVSGLRTNTTGTVIISIWRINAESPSPTENEFGGKLMAVNQGIRFRNGMWQYSAGTAPNYDGAISSGSTFYIVSGVENHL